MGTTIDKICNVYDMASNCREWTTETYSPGNGSGAICAIRGGCYSSTGACTSTQSQPTYLWCPEEYSFRPLLYLTFLKLEKSTFFT